MKRELGMIAVLLLLVGAVAAREPSKFLATGNLEHLGERVALLSIFAIGEAVVIIAGGIDLSIGSLIGLSALLCAKLTVEREWAPAAAVAAAAATAAAGGALQGALVTGLNLQPFIVTLGGMMLFRGIVEVVSRGGGVGINGEQFPGFKAWGASPHQLVVLAVVAASVFFVMRQTLFGRYCYAVGSNAEAARLSGVPVRAVRFATYVISGTLAGVAGILYAVYLPLTESSTGETYELNAVAAAVLGGCSLRGGQGSVLGVLIGASILYVIDNEIILLRIDTLWQRAIVGAIILIAAVADELLARRRRR